MPLLLQTQTKSDQKHGHTARHHQPTWKKSDNSRIGGKKSGSVTQTENGCCFTEHGWDSANANDVKLERSAQRYNYTELCLKCRDSNRLAFSSCFFLLLALPRFSPLFCPNLGGHLPPLPRTPMIASSAGKPPGEAAILPGPIYGPTGWACGRPCMGLPRWSIAIGLILPVILPYRNRIFNMLSVIYRWVCNFTGGRHPQRPDSPETPADDHKRLS